MKLAGQVEAALGRPVLDALLRNAVPDLSYEPSPLHSQLLNLPWNDVFTTNYDTLLERARESVTLKHYDVVTKKDDLLYANKPRIIKLHGSFPSPPFVITEEDYRRYPSDRAPFVNTVRQSLLENTLCLIGFSGDDPNFLQWIGWIRDHIGMETASKIYLAGSFDTLTEADRKLLDDRGIVAVDLSVFSADPGKALDKFLKYLKNRKTRAADWPTVSVNEPIDGHPEMYPDVATEWRRQRGEYPGWVVMPEDRRRFLWDYTKHWLSRLSHMSPADRAQLDTPLDLDLAFELTWRLDRCLFPLIGELPAFLEEVAMKYSGAMLELPETTDWTKTSVLEAVADIRLWLLRYYRERGLNEKWQGVRQAIKDDCGRLLPDHRARFRLEEVQALFRFDPDEAKRLLADWPSTDNLPFWEAKRAALMAELGDAAAARSILESSLSAIRQQLNLNPVIEDYTLVSQESVVMLLLWEVKDGMSEFDNIFGELSERWNELTRYKCDPRREMGSLSARLRHPSKGWRSESKTHSFDLGLVSETFHFGFDEEAVAAYGLLRMYEDIGMPYRMESATFVEAPVSTALPRMRFLPHWALANIVRLGDADATDWLFDREYLAGLGQDDADRFFDIYLPALERTIAMVNEPDRSEAKIFASLAKTLPEVFSRLCYKCSPECRERLVAALGAIYQSKGGQMFEGVGSFAKRLFDSMSAEEHARAVLPVINIPAPDHLGESERQEFVNPVLLVDQSKLVRGEAFHVTAERIDELLDQTTDDAQDSDWAMTSLVWLHERGKLNKQQSERLGKALWDNVETPEVPVVAGYDSFECMRLPHPREINPEPRVKEHWRSMIGSRMGDSRRDAVLRDAVLEELHKSAGVVKWSKAEALELVAEFSGWWNKNKYQLHHHMRSPLGSPADVTKRTIGKVVNALSAVFSHLPSDRDGEEEDMSLQEFLSDLEKHDIPAKRLEAAILSMAPKVREQTLRRVASVMLNNDCDVVADALMATNVLAIALSEEETRAEFTIVAIMLVQGVQWRHRPALAIRLHIVAGLVKRQSWFLSTEALSGLLAGLGEIKKETTSHAVRGNDRDGVISIRAAAAALAFALFGYYQESGSDEPEVIRGWREVCSDPDEFPEVKNSWMVAGG